MRRSPLTALASVSLAALLSFSSAGYAAQSGIHLGGVLKVQDHWKVGIVNPGTGAFCAMVNKFDQHVGLAFALSPEGFGSVAVDVGQKAFEAGKAYQAVLATTGGRTEKIEGHATGAQSVVLQIGRNDAFYDSLARKPGLTVTLPAFKAAFDLDKFKSGYKELVACAASLSKTAPMPAAPVKDVEKQALAAPLDRALDKIATGGKKAVQTASADADAQAAGAAAIDAQVDADSATVIDNGATVINNGVAVINNGASLTQKPARKLLASLDDDDAAVSAPAQSGDVARNWDAQQAGEVAKQQAAEKAYAASVKEREQALAQMKEAVAAQQQAAAQKAAQDAQAEKAMQTAKAEQAAKAEKTAVAEKAQSAALQSKIAALQSKLDASHVEQQKLQASVTALTAKNDKAQDALTARAAALADKEKTLSATAAEVKELASVRADLKTLRATHAATIAKLQRSLSDKDAQYAALQAQVDKLNAGQADTLALKAKLSAAQKEIAGIRKSLVVVTDVPDAKAVAVKAQLEKANAEIAALRAKNAHLSDSLASVAQKNAVVKKEQAAQTAPVRVNDDALKTARAEIETLRAKNAELSRSLAGVTLSDDTQKAAKAEPAPVKEAAAKATHDDASAQQKIALMGAQAEIMKLKTEKLALQQKLDMQQQVDAFASRKPVSDDINWTPRAAMAYAHVAVKTVTGTVAHSTVAQKAPVPVQPQPQPTLAQAQAAARVQPAAGDSAANSGFDNANGSFNANKAEAFLDRIMSYHRVPGRDTDVKPAVKKTPPAQLAPVSVQAPVVQPVPAPVMHEEAPAPYRAPVQHSSFAPQADAPVKEVPLAAPVAQPVVQPVAQIDPISLDALLRQAGLSTVRYVQASSEGHVRQWTTGKLNGMVEQMPAGRFDALVQGYIERYRQDCGQQLKVDMGAVQTLGAGGTLQQASVTCPTQSNSYDTSFVFLQNAKTFSAVLHTGYPADAARISAIGDNIAYALKGAGGLELSGDAVGQTAQNAPLRLQAAGGNDFPPPVTQEQAPLRLNVPSVSSGARAPAQGDDALQTVVVQ